MLPVQSLEQWPVYIPPRGQDENNSPAPYPAESPLPVGCWPPPANASNAGSDRSWGEDGHGYIRPHQSQSRNVPARAGLTPVATQDQAEYWSKWGQSALSRYAWLRHIMCRQRREQPDAVLSLCRRFQLSVAA